jgi:hypothetical protein
MQRLRRKERPEETTLPDLPCSPAKPSRPSRTSCGRTSAWTATLSASDWEAAEKYEKEALAEKEDGQERLEALARSERSARDAIYATVFNLDRKNPNSTEDGPGDPDKLLIELQNLEAEIGATRGRLKQDLITALSR